MATNNNNNNKDPTSNINTQDQAADAEDFIPVRNKTGRPAKRKRSELATNTDRPYKLNTCNKYTPLSDSEGESQPSAENTPVLKTQQNETTKCLQ